MRDAMVVTDARSQIVYANDRAEALLATATPIKALRQRGAARATLASVRASDTVALQAMIAAACTVGAGDRSAADDEPGGGTVVLRRQGGGAPLMALIGPLRKDLPAMQALSITRHEPQAVVIIVDPGEDVAEGGTDGMVRHYLRTAFELTEAEAAVAVVLADGCGLSRVAESRGVSLATVRTQAQRIYDKTGMCTQAALAVFIIRVVSGIARARGFI